QALSEAERMQLEAWLVDFDLCWEQGKFARRARELPSTGALRHAALVELVKIDLERRWRRGERPCLEEYLRDHPELGHRAAPPADLIQAEQEVRSQFGEASVRPSTLPLRCNAGPEPPPLLDSLPELFG